MSIMLMPSNAPSAAQHDGRSCCCQHDRKCGIFVVLVVLIVSNNVGVHCFAASPTRRSTATATATAKPPQTRCTSTAMSLEKTAVLPCTLKRHVHNSRYGLVRTWSSLFANNDKDDETSTSSLSSAKNSSIPSAAAFPSSIQNDEDDVEDGIPLRGGMALPDISFWPSMDELDLKLIKITLPCIANFAIAPLIGAVDLFWVSRMGNALAVAGQAAANQVFNSAFWIASFLPSVTATLVAKEYAKGDKDLLQDAVCQALVVGILIALIGTPFLFFRPERVLSAVLPAGAPAMEYAKPYLMIRSFAFLPSIISAVGFSAFRGVLDTVTPVKISSFANVFNAVLDPLLIFTLKMGVPGAALATLASEVISAITYISTMFQKEMISWSKLFRLPSWTKLQPLLRGGAALQLRNFAINITFLAVQRVTQSIDETGVSAAAHAMAIQTFQIGAIVLFALSSVAQAVVPNEMVEKWDPDQGKMVGGIYAAKATVNRLMSWGFLLGCALGALQIMLLPILCKTTPLQEVRTEARLPSYLASVYQIINGMVFIGEGVMVGCGNFLQLSLSTLVATAATLWALKTFPAQFGLTGVWMGFGVFNSIRLLGVWLHQTRNGPLAPRNLAKAAHN